MPPKGPSDKTASRSLTATQIAYRVKEAILVIYGMNQPDPDSLSGTQPMSSFDFNDFQWIELAGRLTGIVQAYRPGQRVAVRDVENMATVQDCIDLVNHLVTPKSGNA
ncbi:MAG TPA: hypothetical protein VFX43_20105 [Chitinophagaceae bacterium]|jgi:hypothetical protein|nr:hypothetical protein [Chitinophagaceae bacterium]